MKFKSLFLAALVAATLTSCDNNDVTNPDVTGPVAVEGVQTYARINLNQLATKATTEAGTADESAIKTAKLFIFKSDGLLEKQVDFPAGASQSTIVPITSGAKSIYVSVNIPGLPAFVENATTKTAFEQNLMTIGAMSDMTSASTGFWMTNFDGASNVVLDPNITDPVAAGKNVVNVNVGRTSAKVRMALAASPVVVGGTATGLQFKMHNIPVNSYLMPVFVSGKRTTPNYSEATVTAADYLSTATGVFGTADTYVNENIHGTPLMGNTTYALIKLIFTPTTTLDANGANAVAGVNAADFWRIKKADGTYTADYYRANPSAAEVTAKGGVNTVKYTSGESFYKLYVADNSQSLAADKYAVIRNYLYNISIVNINGAGENSEDGVIPGTPSNPGEKPNDPIVQTTNMVATINVLPWYVVNQNGGI